MLYIYCFQILRKRDSHFDTVRRKRIRRKRRIEDIERPVYFRHPWIFTAKSFPGFFGHNELTMVREVNAINTRSMPDRRHLICLTLMQYSRRLRSVEKIDLFPPPNRTPIKRRGSFPKVPAFSNHNRIFTRSFDSYHRHAKNLSTEKLHIQQKNSSRFVSFGMLNFKCQISK